LKTKTWGTPKSEDKLKDPGFKNRNLGHPLNKERESGKEGKPKTRF